VVIDNDNYEDVTVITIDSANRPGTLIEVVQCLTELNLSIRKARISSDGGWFVDEFFVTESPKGKVIHRHKLDLIKRVLSVDGYSTGTGGQHTSGGGTGAGTGALTSVPPAQLPSEAALAVFELSGRDQRGLTGAVLTTMAARGCDVQSVAVWTYHNRVAMVVGVVDRQALAQFAGGRGTSCTPALLGAGAGGAPSGIAGGSCCSSSAVLSAMPAAAATAAMSTGGRSPSSAMSSSAALAGLPEPDPARMEGLAQVC
jgi:hypothetical protein